MYKGGACMSKCKSSSVCIWYRISSKKMLIKVTEYDDEDVRPEEKT